MLRIVAGTHRSRILVTPEGASSTRPMGSRTKEAIFDILRGWFDGTRVLDLYAGVGTMGLEALSRGASEVVMVEKDRRVLACLKANIAALRCEQSARVAALDVLGAELLTSVGGPFDVVFCDPPFDAFRRRASRAKILARLDDLRSVIAPRSFVVLRVPDLPTREEPVALPHFDGPEVHSYGNEQHVLIFAPKPGATGAPAVPGSQSATGAGPEADLPPLV